MSSRHQSFHIQAKSLEVERIRKILNTIKDLASLYSGTDSNMRSLLKELQCVEELLRKDQFGEVGKKLTKLGVLCLAIPEPIASNVFGGILLTTGIMWQYYQIIVRERVEEMYPGLARLLGRA